MAGVPHITAGMLDALTGTLEGGAPLLSRTIGCWTAESEVADILRKAEADNDGVQIGSYPFFRDGRTGANFVVRSTDAELLEVRRVASAFDDEHVLLAWLRLTLNLVEGGAALCFGFGAHH